MIEVDLDDFESLGEIDVLPEGPSGSKVVSTEISTSIESESEVEMQDITDERLFELGDDDPSSACASILMRTETGDHGESFS